MSRRCEVWLLSEDTGRWNRHEEWCDRIETTRSGALLMKGDRGDVISAISRGWWRVARMLDEEQ